jgi:hypothetical protein
MAEFSTPARMEADEQLGPGVTKSSSSSRLMALIRPPPHSAPSKLLLPGPSDPLESELLCRFVIEPFLNKNTIKHFKKYIKYFWFYRPQFQRAAGASVHSLPPKSSSFSPARLQFRPVE